MLSFFQRQKATVSLRLLGALLIFFLFISLAATYLPKRSPKYADFLPPPGKLVALTPAFIPPLLRGLTIYPQDPFRFDFYIENGDKHLKDEQFKQESRQLIKYFLAALTIPEEDFWVNLSPYEQERIAPEDLGVTELGKALLGQDYILKQLLASLMHPDSETGKEFWKRVYRRAHELYGTTKIPINTFNKIWIMPEKALVYARDNTAYVVESRLKVLLEEDYLALKQNLNHPAPGSEKLSPDKTKVLCRISSNLIKEVILPEIETEINQGENFASLRQAFNAMVLAAWFKRRLKTHLLNQVYTDKAKLKGVDLKDKATKQKIYQQYLEAYRQGVYNYIKTEYDPNMQKNISRQYYSGGFAWGKPGEWLGETGQAPLSRREGANVQVALRAEMGQTRRVSSPSESSGDELKVLYNAALAGDSSAVNQLKAFALSSDHALAQSAYEYLDHLAYKESNLESIQAVKELALSADIPREAKLNSNSQGIIDDLAYIVREAQHHISSEARKAALDALEEIMFAYAKSDTKIADYILNRIFTPLRNGYINTIPDGAELATQALKRMVESDQIGSGLTAQALTAKPEQPLAVFNTVTDPAAQGYTPGHKKTALENLNLAQAAQVIPRIKELVFSQDHALAQSAYEYLDHLAYKESNLDSIQAVKELALSADIPRKAKLDSNNQGIIDDLAYIVREIQLNVSREARKAALAALEEILFAYANDTNIADYILNRVFIALREQVISAIPDGAELATQALKRMVESDQIGPGLTARALTAKPEQPLAVFNTVTDPAAQGYTPGHKKTALENLNLAQAAQVIPRIKELVFSQDHALAQSAYEYLDHLAYKESNLDSIQAVKELALSADIPRKAKLDSNNQGIIDDLAYIVRETQHHISSEARKAALAALGEIAAADFADDAIIRYLQNDNGVKAIIRSTSLPAIPQDLWELLQTANQDAPSNKQINLESFMADYWLTVARLYHLDPRYCRQIFDAILSGLGPKRLAAFLKDIQPALWDETIYPALKSIFKQAQERDHAYAQRIIELAAAYKDLGISQLFVQLAAQEAQKRRVTVRQVYLALAQELIKAFAQKLGVTLDRVTAETIENWYLPYLSKLFVGRRIVYAHGSSHRPLQQLFDSVIKATLEGKFAEMITDTSDANAYPMGKRIAEQNQKVRKALELLGIDLEEWLGYQEEARFSLEQAQGSRIDVAAELQGLAEQFFALLDKLQEKHGNMVRGSLGKMGLELVEDAQGRRLVQNNGRQETNQKVALKALMGLLFKNQGNFSKLQKSLNFLDRNYQGQEAATLIFHIREKLEMLNRLVNNPAEFKKALEGPQAFLIRRWARNPGRDIFQGNFTGCCVAIDNDLHPEAIIEYLIDQGIQIVEVVDEATGLAVAQTWVFVAVNQNGKPVLVLDNIEVEETYPKTSGQNKIIRDHLVAYMQKYAQAIDVEELYLGVTQYNDVNTSDYPTVSDQLVKPGGYLWDFEGANYTYYLESMYGETVQQSSHRADGSIPSTARQFHRLPLPKLPPKPVDNSRIGVDRVLPDQAEGILDQLVQVEAGAYSNPELRLGREFLRHSVNNPQGVNMVLRYKGRIIGYALSVPAEDEEAAPQIPHSLYLEDFAILPEFRNNPAANLKFIRGFLREVTNGTYQTVTLHTHGGIVKFLVDDFGFAIVGKEDNWLDSGETFYLLRWDKASSSVSSPSSSPRREELERLRDALMNAAERLKSNLVLHHKEVEDFHSTVSIYNGQEMTTGEMLDELRRGMYRIKTREELMDELHLWMDWHIEHALHVDSVVSHAASRSSKQVVRELLIREFDLKTLMLIDIEYLEGEGKGFARGGYGIGKHEKLDEPRQKQVAQWYNRHLYEGFEVLQTVLEERELPWEVDFQEYEQSFKFWFPDNISRPIARERQRGQTYEDSVNASLAEVNAAIKEVNEELRQYADPDESSSSPNASSSSQPDGTGKDITRRRFLKRLTATATVATVAPNDIILPGSTLPSPASPVRISYALLRDMLSGIGAVQMPTTGSRGNLIVFDDFPFWWHLRRVLPEGQKDEAEKIAEKLLRAAVLEARQRLRTAGIIETGEAAEQVIGDIERAFDDSAHEVRRTIEKGGYSEDLVYDAIKKAQKAIAQQQDKKEDGLEQPEPEIMYTDSGFPDFDITQMQDIELIGRIEVIEADLFRQLQLRSASDRDIRTLAGRIYLAQRAAEGRAMAEVTDLSPIGNITQDDLESIGGRVLGLMGMSGVGESPPEGQPKQAGLTVLSTTDSSSPNASSSSQPTRRGNNAAGEGVGRPFLKGNQTPGGIDFNPDNLDLQVIGDNSRERSRPFPAESQLPFDTHNFQGFTFQILKIEPVTDPVHITKGPQLSRR